MHYLGNMKVQDKEGNIWSINGISFGNEEVWYLGNVIKLPKMISVSRSENPKWSDDGSSIITETYCTTFNYQEVKLDENNNIVDIKF